MAITLFDKHDFRGESLVVNQDIDDLTNTAVGNRTSSIRLTSDNDVALFFRRNGWHGEAMFRRGPLNIENAGRPTKEGKTGFGNDIRSVRLTPHASLAGDAVLTIEARIARNAYGMLTVSYRLEGDIRRLRVPSAQPPRFAEGLWRHTCFELFVRRGGVPAYHELNFSPSGEWAVYAFERYRQGVAIVDDALDPRIAVEPTASTLKLSAGIPLRGLSPMHSDGVLSLALSAVIEDVEGTLSYWALAHPADKPDFHHPDSFTLQLS